MDTVHSVCGATWTVGDVRAVHRLEPLGADTWGNGAITAQREWDKKGNPIYRVTWGRRPQDYNILVWLGNCYGRGVPINSTRTAVILRKDGDALVLEFADADGRSGWLAVPELDT